MKAIIKVLLLFVVALVSSDAAKGEHASTKKHRVLYNPRVPLSIRQKTSTIAITRFYGETIIKGQKVALHFYDSQPMKKINKYTAQQSSRLDLFIESRHREQRLFKRINTIPITYHHWPGGKLIVQMEVLWLAPASQTKPIIKVRVETRLSSGEMSGDDLLFIFPNGLRKSAATQSFDFNYLSGSSGALSNEFGKADKKGFITILQKYVGGNGIEYTAWKWNGSRFAVVQELHISHEYPRRYKWNGEQLVEE